MSKNILNPLKFAIKSASKETKSESYCFRGKYDIVVVGGGIVGVATARELSNRFRNFHMAILEKENLLATHQTCHNSGVIHAGIYYKPFSLKAKLCVDGSRMLYKYCEQNKIPFKKVGKLIVATEKSELVGLQSLYERGLQNCVPELRILDGNKISSIEPNCVGLKAIWSPMTGIVDFTVVTKSFGNDFVKNEGNIILNFEVAKFCESSDPEYPVGIHSTNNKALHAKYVLTCGGLYSDKLAIMTGCSEVPKIVPFRGEYLILKDKKSDLVRGNIYPVPDGSLPFLGVHYTPRMDGSIWLGPNAVLAFQREGYKWSDINTEEFVDMIKFPGFRRLAKKYRSAGINEVFHSIFLSQQVKILQRFVPSLKVSHVERGPAGVRAQALNADGELVDDFIFDCNYDGIGKRIFHCRNAPSPGATSSLAIAKMLADQMMEISFRKC